MQRLNIYVSGPISGTSDFRERFFKACQEVLRLGYNPVCPLDVPKNCVDDGSDEVWLTCMRADIPALINCSGIYLMVGWENSRGARLEKLIADGLDLIVLYQAETAAKEK